MDRFFLCPAAALVTVGLLFVQACDDATCVVPPTVSGNPVIAERANSAFTDVTWSGEHKQDIDANEDGCLQLITLTFTQSGACPLEMRAGNDASGDFAVLQMSVNADSNCAEFPDDREGVYTLAPDSERVTVQGLPAAVPDDNATDSCFAADVTFDGIATLVTTGGAPPLTVDFSDVAVRGDLPSRGNPGATCAEPE